MQVIERGKHLVAIGTTLRSIGHRRQDMVDERFAERREVDWRREMEERRLFYSFEIVISLSVMNSNNAGWPSLVAAIPRSMADRMSPGSVIRSP